MKNYLLLIGLTPPGCIGGCTAEIPDQKKPNKIYCKSFLIFAQQLTLPATF